MASSWDGIQKGAESFFVAIEQADDSWGNMVLFLAFNAILFRFIHSVHALLLVHIITVSFFYFGTKSFASIRCLDGLVNATFLGCMFLDCIHRRQMDHFLVVVVLPRNHLDILPTSSMRGCRDCGLYRLWFVFFPKNGYRGTSYDGSPHFLTPTEASIVLLRARQLQWDQRQRLLRLRATKQNTTKG